MLRSDFARHDTLMKRLIVDEDGLDVRYWRMLTDGGVTKPSRVKKSGIRVPVTINSSSSSLSSNKSTGRNFEKYSRRTRRSRVGSVEMTTEEIAEEILIPDAISLLRGNSSSSNEDQYENRDFSPPLPRETPQILQQSTLVERPATLAGQSQASKVGGLTNSCSKANRLFRSPPVKEMPQKSTATPPREEPQVPPSLLLQERSADLGGQNHAGKFSGLTNSRSRLLLRSTRVNEPTPQEEPQAPAPPPLQVRAVSLTGQTQHKVSGVTNSKAPFQLGALAVTDPSKVSLSTTPPQESTAASLPIQSQLGKVGPPKAPLPPQMTSAPPPPPPPKILTSSKAPPPPPPPKTLTSSKAPPPPPPPKTLTSSKPPPPPPLLPTRPPKASDSSSVSKPPPPSLPLRPSKRDAKAGKNPSGPSVGGGSSQDRPAEAVADDKVKLKPLHWEKVNVDTEHSMVWNKIDGGSFRVDDDLMEALFGSSASNQKPVDDAKPNRPKSDPPSTKIFILEIRKSQNISIILRSLGVSHGEILQSLDDGHGLMAETLERLNQIILSTDEQSRILRFDGDVSRLADAESFLFKLLKASPSAFTRFHAMLFKLTFDSEISHLRDSMKAMEAGCKELRNDGIFVKLLEAILKAGNRMNAGTTRGDAAAFNLNSLKKLADVKSVDGKTTLLHFVVEEVARSEGKRRVLNQTQNSDQSKEEKEREYTVLGLSVVKALSAEFSNVKKVAAIDSKSLSATVSSLSSRLIGYQKEMIGFIAGAEKELESIRKRQVETLDLVKKTTQYFGLKDDGGINPLQIFVVVKDFLAMVDKVCAEIARNLQRKKAVVKPTTTTTTTTESSTPAAAVIRPAKFINLPAHFMAGNSTSDDSDTEF